MYKGVRTDMADERRADIGEARAEGIKGLDCDIQSLEGVKITRIEVKSAEASEAMGKPTGTYITLDTDPNATSDDPIWAMAKMISRFLAPLLPAEGGILAVGLGNRFVTADSLGPLFCEKLIVTRHLRSRMPELFSSMRELSSIAPGVMGQTGMEALELIGAACTALRPAAVIAADALAAKSLRRLGRSYQISTGGIIPGEGAGSRRFALSRETLGVPVISLGVPTVVDAATLVRDITGRYDEAISDGDFLVSPGDVDSLAAKSAKALAFGVNLALHGDMSPGDMEQLLS